MTMIREWGKRNLHWIAILLLCDVVQCGDSCTLQQFTELTGVITSPNYPDEYSNNLHCYYDIQVPLGYYVQLTFYEFKTEECCDYVNLCTMNEKNNCTKLAGSHGLGQSYQSVANEMTLEFYTDPTHTDLGFYAVYTAVLNTQVLPTNRCPQSMYTMPYGVITSPNWPADYANSMNCTYLISPVDKDQMVVELMIIDFNTEPCCDYIKIHDGDSSNANLIAKVSGNNSTGIVYHSTGPQMFVRFISDLTGTRRGFSAAYRLVANKKRPL